MENTMRLEKKIFGTTLYVGKLPLETHYGVFNTYVFQNLIHKGYILALTMGDLEGSEHLYTRMHSSCVTSESLRSTDCDCVLQLEGAMKEIQKQKNGVLFYLIQEGRGCGYVGKSRACMMVQYSNDVLTTFDAYRDMGMKADYRDYSNIYEVAYMLGIEKQKFVLMTNNPDKIKGFEEVGLTLESIHGIEIEPSPFNQDYLISKEKYGHLLFQTKKKNTKYRLPHERVKPFAPFHLEKLQRFLFCASYYLPIKPVANQIIVTEERMLELTEKGFDPTQTFNLPNGTILAKMPIGTLKQIDFDPYWFKVNMFYDLGTYTDFVVLTYGDLSEGIPLVRVHSESIFNRFPLMNDSYKEKYRRSQEEIVKNGCGIILLFHRDGRGSGLSNYVLNNTKESETIGIKADARDAFAASQLVEYLLPEGHKTIAMLYSSSSRIGLEDALAKQGITVARWIPFSDLDKQKGHDVIQYRINSIPYYLNKINVQHTKLDTSKKYVITGVGSSEAHARYFCYLVEKFQKDVSITFRPLTFFESTPAMDELSKDTHLILVSQGLSPHACVPLNFWEPAKTTLFTAVTEKNKNEDKAAIVKRIREAGGSVITCPLEDEYLTLIRFVGPFCCYFGMYQYVSTTPLLDFDQRKVVATLFRAQSKTPPTGWITSAMECSRVIVVGTFNISPYWHNLLYKLEEGPFVSMVRGTELLEFAHGTFQNMEHQRKAGVNTCVAFIGCDSNKDALAQAREMLGDKYPCWVVNSDLPDELKILEFETVFNYLVLAWIEKKGIDQVAWAGKERQGILYSRTPVANTPCSRSRSDSRTDVSSNVNSDPSVDIDTLKGKLVAEGASTSSSTTS
eukprot:m.6423 g.6423  ORF g.6423 m.6423 type:complete len:846 (-) comp2594_c0_seq1:51-2588(-)